MSTHTKEKWAWKQNRGNNYYEHSIFVQNEPGGKVIAELSGEGCTKEEVKANACLIAAAPILLEACQSLLDTYLDSLNDGTGCTCQRCSDASVKARQAIIAAMQTS